MDDKDLVLKVERVDGVEYEVGSDAHRNAVIKGYQTRIDALTADLAKQSTLAETAKADKAKLEGEIAALKDPARLDAAVTARAALIESAKLVLGAEAKFDGQLDLDIKRSVAEKAYPSLKFDAKDAIRIETAFETAMANASQAVDKQRADAAAVGGVRAAIVTSAREDEKPNPDKAREEMIKRNNSAWKPADSGAAGK